MTTTDDPTTTKLYLSVWACVLCPLVIRFIQYDADMVIGWCHINSKSPSLRKATESEIISKIDRVFHGLMDVISVVLFGWMIRELVLHSTRYEYATVLDLYQAATIDLPSYAWSIDWVTAFIIIFIGYFIGIHRSNVLGRKQAFYTVLSSITCSPGILLYHLPSPFVVIRHSILHAFVMFGILIQIVMWGIPVFHYQWSRGNFFFDHFMPYPANMNPINLFVIGSVVLIYFRLVWQLTRSIRTEYPDAQFVGASYRYAQEMKWILGSILAFCDVSLYMLVMGIVIAKKCAVSAGDEICTLSADRPGASCEPKSKTT